MLPTSAQANTRRPIKPAREGGRAGAHDGRQTAPTPLVGNTPGRICERQRTRWDDAAAIARGEQLYQTYCLMCHGADGKGKGLPPRACRMPRLTSPTTFTARPVTGMPISSGA